MGEDLVDDGERIFSLERGKAETRDKAKSLPLRE
jgi:hypothetical protein